MADIMEIIMDRDPQEREFHQAVREVMENPYIPVERPVQHHNKTLCIHFPPNKILLLSIT